jgi:hypothetical protein
MQNGDVIASDNTGSFSSATQVNRTFGTLGLATSSSAIPGSNVYLTGGIAEVILFDRMLPEAARMALDAHLTKKWINGPECGPGFTGQPPACTPCPIDAYKSINGSAACFQCPEGLSVCALL